MLFLLGAAAWCLCRRSARSRCLPLSPRAATAAATILALNMSSAKITWPIFSPFYTFFFNLGHWFKSFLHRLPPIVTGKRACPSGHTQNRGVKGEKVSEAFNKLQQLVYFQRFIFTANIVIIQGRGDTALYILLYISRFGYLQSIL